MNPKNDLQTMDDSIVMQRGNESRRQRVHADWRAHIDSVPTGISAQALLQLWSRYKYVVLAQDERMYRRIGPLLANLSSDVSVRAEHVLKLVMEAMTATPSRRNHVNALHHVAGHVKNALDETDKQRWRQVVEDYESGGAPLQVPGGLLQQYLQRYGSDYARSQYYPALFLDPCA
jgi:uncharacterized protein YbgA (DUF1722 family)